MKNIIKLKVVLGGTLSLLSKNKSKNNNHNKSNNKTIYIENLISEFLKLENISWDVRLTSKVSVSSSYDFSFRH